MGKKKRKLRQQHKRKYKQSSEKLLTRPGIVENYELVSVHVSANLLESQLTSKEIEKYKKLGIFIDL